MLALGPQLMSVPCPGFVPREDVRKEQGRGALPILSRDSSRGWDDITCRNALVGVVQEPRGLRAVRDGPHLFSWAGRAQRLRRNEVFAGVNAEQLIDLTEFVLVAFPFTITSFSALLTPVQVRIDILFTFCFFERRDKLSQGLQ